MLNQSTPVKAAPSDKALLTANNARDLTKVGVGVPKPVPITDQQKALWTQTRSKFLWEAPGFTHILYKLMSPGVPDHIIWTEDVPTAATDGIYVFANPGWYFKISLPGRTFVLGHEVLHAVFNHAIVFHGWRTRGKVTLPNGTVLPYDEGTMQRAADFIINAILADSKIGKPPTEDFAKPQLEPAFISHKDQLVEAYAKVYKKFPPQKGGGGGKAGSGFDQVLLPGKGNGQTPGQAKATRNEQVWKTNIAAAMAAQKARGLLSGSLNEVFGELIEPSVAWDEYIHGWFKRKLGSGSWNYRSPDRRFISRPDQPIYAPARQGFGCEEVWVGVDTSGSIAQKELQRFMAEMVGVVQDVRPKRLMVAWCDATVHRVDEVSSYEDLMDLRCKGAPGRGGTAFEPVFDEIKKRGVRPDALIYLTDGLGSFPATAPDYPMLWASICKSSNYPFGDVVNIPV